LRLHSKSQDEIAYVNVEELGSTSAKCLLEDW